MASAGDGSPLCYRTACDAMATRFELLLWGQSEHLLRAAAEGAVEEILLWHRRLSYFEHSSDVSRLNELAHSASIVVDAEFFHLLMECRRLRDITQGAFDPAIGGMMKAVGFRGGSTSFGDIDTLIKLGSFSNIELDASQRSVRFMTPHVRLDMGAVGKGWAIDQAMLVLRDAGVQRAFVHGGTSSVGAFGASAESPWMVRVTQDAHSPIISITDGGIGVSASSGRVVNGRGHVLNPKSGASAPMTAVCAVGASTATEADAISTALLVDGIDAPWLPENIGCFARQEVHGELEWRERGFPVILRGPGETRPIIDRRLYRAD